MYFLVTVSHSGQPALGVPAWTGDWTKWPPKLPFNLSYPMILCYGTDAESLIQKLHWKGHRVFTEFLMALLIKSTCFKIHCSYKESCLRANLAKTAWLMLEWRKTLGSKDGGNHKRKYIQIHSLTEESSPSILHISLF